MIQIILVNEESRASQYGIGTYIKQLCLILSQKQGIHLSVICCRSTKNDFYIERKGDIDYYHIPDTIQNNDPEIRIKTYYKNIWYLIFPYFSSHSKENIILHINYYQHIHLLNTFRAFFSKGRCCFTIHYMDWCFKIKGNYSYLKSILYKELDSIKNPLEKNIKEICEKEKNVFELQIDPYCHLVIVGDGFYSYYLNSCNPTWNKITFTGKLNKEDLYKLYQIADIGVLPSFHEQCSYVAIEMMMYGIPLVASTSTGLSEMIEDGVSGYHIPIIEYENHTDLNTYELQSKLLILLKDSSMRKEMAKNSRLRYERYYTSEIFSSCMQEFYNRFVL